MYEAERIHIQYRIMVWMEQWSYSLMNSTSSIPRIKTFHMYRHKPYLLLLMLPVVGYRRKRHALRLTLGSTARRINAGLPHRYLRLWPTWQRGEKYIQNIFTRPAPSRERPRVGGWKPTINATTHSVLYLIAYVFSKDSFVNQRFTRVLAESPRSQRVAIIQCGAAIHAGRIHCKIIPRPGRELALEEYQQQQASTTKKEQA